MHMDVAAAAHRARACCTLRKRLARDGSGWLGMAGRGWLGMAGDGGDRWAWLTLVVYRCK